MPLKSLPAYVSIVFILANRSMTCWSTDEGWDTPLLLVLQMDDWCFVSERMLIAILSVSVNPCEMLWAEAALALTPLCGDLKPEYFLRPFLLMWLFQTLHLSWIQFYHSVISLGARLWLFANLSLRQSFLALFLKCSLVLS